MFALGADPKYFSRDRCEECRDAGFGRTEICYPNDKVFTVAKVEYEDLYRKPKLSFCTANFAQAS